MYGISTGVWRYKEKLNELDEIYAKAQAFDEIADVKSSLGICEDYTLEHSYDEDPVFEEMYYINQVVRFIRETIEQVEDDDQ